MSQQDLFSIPFSSLQQKEWKLEKNKPPPELAEAKDVEKRKQQCTHSVFKASLLVKLWEKAPDDVWSNLKAYPGTMFQTLSWKPTTKASSDEPTKAWSTWQDDWQEQWPNADDEWPDDDDSQHDNDKWPSWNEWQSGSQAWQDDQSWGLWQDRGQSSGSRTSDSGDLTTKIHMVSFGDFEIGETQ